jgi:hypothetical protein
MYHYHHSVAWSTERQQNLRRQAEQLRQAQRMAMARQERGPREACIPGVTLLQRLGKLGMALRPAYNPGPHHD